jgi:serine/threonine protein kinase
MSRQPEFTGNRRFVLERRLGQGGMGVVYQVLDRDQGRRVALKTLRHLDASALYRFKNEFRALQDLRHENLVTLGELIEEHGHWFFTMELVEGESFLQFVRPGLADHAFAPTQSTGSDSATNGSDFVTPATLAPAARPEAGLDEARLRAALAQLARGVAALHAAGMVHRDIKPSNVRVTPTGRVVLLDFGLVTAAGVPDGDPGEPHIVGTAAYMAPEQAASKPVGPEADWYSLGVVLYEALTGQLPFSGTALQIFMDKQQREPAPPRALVPDVAPDLDVLCSELLRRDAGVRPGGHDILTRLGVERAEPSAGAATSHMGRATPFVGRSEEIDALRAAFAHSRHGHCVLVRVRGESGVGKSALIRHFVRTARNDTPDTVVLTGRCYERESVPYKAFDGVIDVLSQYMARLDEAEANFLVPRHAALLPRVFPVLERVEAIAQVPVLEAYASDPHALRNRVFTALRELLCRLAERHPVIIVIDDLQWADADSLHLLRELLRAPEAPAILLALSERTRSVDPVDVATEPLLAADVRHIHLGPLDTRAARALARHLLARADVAEHVSPMSIVVEARGHPLYIDELVRHAGLGGEKEHKRLRLDEAIWARVAPLPASARNVLELVAVAGTPLAQDIIRRAAQQDLPDFTQAVALLRVANLVRGRGNRSSDPIEPYHDRVREAVFGNLAEARRVARHARLAVALESADMDRVDRAEILIRHLEAAGTGAKAAVCALEAAERATRILAFDRAAELIRIALRLGEHEVEPRRALTIRLGEALVHAGRGAEAAAAFEAAADGADPATRLACRTQAAEQLLVCGHVERGMAATRAVLAEVGARLPATPRRAVLSLVWQRLKLRVRGLRFTERTSDEIAAEDLTRVDVYKAVAQGLAMVDTIRSMDFQARTLLGALDLGERTRIGQALVREAAFSATRGGKAIGRAQSLLDRAFAIAEEANDPALRAWAIGGEGIVRFYERRFRLAAERTAEADDLLQEVTVAAFEIDAIRRFRLEALTNIGLFSQVVPLCESYLLDARRRGDRHLECAVRRDNLDARLALDKLDVAREDMAWADAVTATDDALGVWVNTIARAKLDLYQGDGAVALVRARPGFAAFTRSLLPMIEGIRVYARSMHGRLALAAAEATADPAPYLREVERMTRRLAKETMPDAAPRVGLLRAGLAVRRGDTDAAIAHLRATVAASEAADTPIQAAAARRRWGELCGGDEGAALIAAADAWMRSESIANPVRFTAVLAPGFATPGRTGPRI